MQDLQNEFTTADAARKVLLCIFPTPLSSQFHVCFSQQYDNGENILNTQFIYMHLYFCVFLEHLKLTPSDAKLGGQIESI